jgi:hypothetical protein
MSIFVSCPDCGRKLRVPEELLGKKVKCPGCGSTFDAQAPPAETVPAAPPPAETVSLPPMKLSVEDEPTASGSPPLGTPHSVTPSPTEPSPPPAPASEGGAAGTGLEPCPYCGERIRKGMLHCPYCEEELRPREESREERGEEERPWEQHRSRPPVRRDCEPHRTASAASPPSRAWRSPFRRGSWGTATWRRCVRARWTPRDRARRRAA